jgi:hypothetical protein
LSNLNAGARRRRRGRRLLQQVHLPRIILPKETLAKLPIDNNCHSERSEEPRTFIRLRSFTPFRMTENPVLQEAQRLQVFSPSPLMGKGWGRGEIAGSGCNLSRSPQHPRTGRGELLRPTFCRVSVGYEPIRGPGGRAGRSGSACRARNRHRSIIGTHKGRRRSHGPEDRRRQSNTPGVHPRRRRARCTVRREIRRG